MSKYEYEVVHGFRGLDMTEDLNQLGAEGYRLITVILHEDIDLPVVAFMEREYKE